MRISTKGRYALHIMADLAQNQTDGYIALKDISEKQGISMKYLEMIAGLLNKAGLIISARGRDGGYRLSKKPEEYTVASILRAAEGSLSPVSCLDTPENRCPQADMCITLPLWEELDRRIDEFLESVTLADLISQGRQSGGRCSF
ncbi:MAG TPA: Rrf2 family transcriptional regulator [Clostridiales bacterium]|nr:Rrf2 family transcriptional regulator [Clostridiales bacterium]